MQPNFNNLFLLGAAVFGLAAATLFTVDMSQQAIVLRFGQPVKVHTDAGLKVKLPWPIETVQYFDSRTLDVDPAPERVNLRSEDAQMKKSDKEGEPDVLSHAGSIPIIVDTFARYRIVDPLLFLQRLKGEANAQARIEVVMNAVTRDVLGKATLTQLLSSQRSSLMNQIRDRVNREMKERGVEVIDVRIGRADLTEQLSDSTVSRMMTERREEATETRAKGQEKAQEIKSTAEKERTIILAQAQRDAEAIRGEGDKKAIEIITAAANQDPEFYAYIKTLFAYQNTLASPDTTLVLTPDNDFLKYMKSNSVGAQ